MIWYSYLQNYLSSWDITEQKNWSKNTNFFYYSCLTFQWWWWECKDNHSWHQRCRGYWVPDVQQLDYHTTGSQWRHPVHVCVCVIQIKFYEDTQNKGAVYWFALIEVVQILLEDNGNIASLPAVIEGGLMKRLLLYQWVQARGYVLTWRWSWASQHHAFRKGSPTKDNPLHLLQHITHTWDYSQNTWLMNIHWI